MAIGYVGFTVEGQPVNSSKIKIGDDPDFVLVIFGDNQENAHIDFIVKNAITDTDDAALISKTGQEGVPGGDIEVTVTGNSLTATFTLESVETSGLPPGSYIYGVQRRVGTKTKTIEEGSFTLELDVVRTND